MKSIQTEKEKVNFSLFSVMCGTLSKCRMPKKKKKKPKLSELIRDFSKDAEYKINTQKSSEYMLTMNNLKVKQAIQFTTASKK